MSVNATVLIRDGRKKAITRLASPTPVSYRIFQFSVFPHSSLQQFLMSQTMWL